MFPYKYSFNLTCLDIEGAGAISKHYKLLTAVMRVISAAVLSRGSQNQQTLEQGRKFLSDNRLSILAVLKKSAGLSVVNHKPDESVQDLADVFMLLMSVTGFVEVGVPYSAILELRLIWHI